MKLKSLLGTTIIALGCIVSNNATFAGAHEKKMQLQQCSNGFSLYHNKRGTNKCLRRGGNGWFPLNGNQASSPRFEKKSSFINVRQKVLWKVKQGLKIAYCQNRGYTPYYKGKGQSRQWGCFNSTHSGWSVYRNNTQQLNGFSGGWPKVFWKGNNGDRVAYCKDRGFAPYYQGQGSNLKWGCFDKPQRGWNQYKLVKLLSGLRHNMKYDNYRWEKKGKVGCSKGTAWYKNYQLHCSK